MFVDANGNEFRSYEDACIYYGCDTPDQVAAEEAYWAEEARLVEDWAALMGEPSPWVAYEPKASVALVGGYFEDDECPF